MNEELKQKIKSLVYQNPKIGNILAHAVRIEEAKLPYIETLGWDWADVKASTQQLKQLVIEGVLKRTYQSAKETRFKLEDLETTKQALLELTREATTREMAITEQLEIPEDIFDIITGYEDVKQWLMRSITGEKPVHILLVGPPASAKSLFLLEISRIRGAKYYLGTSSTKAGIQRYLIEQRPHILILDEIDKMEPQDQAALFSVMETGIIAELKTGRVQQAYIPGFRVYAAGNTEQTLADALRSRFLTFHFKPYTPEQFREITINILTRREGKTREYAEHLTNLLLQTGTRDPRKAVQIARLTKTQEEAEKLIQDLKKYSSG